MWRRPTRATAREGRSAIVVVMMVVVPARVIVVVRLTNKR
jgi:hypothetical protein